MSGRVRLVRWGLWLLAGVLAGLAAGFVVGLGRPRPREALTYAPSGARGTAAGEEPIR